LGNNGNLFCVNKLSYSTQLLRIWLIRASSPYSTGNGSSYDCKPWTAVSPTKHVPYHQRTTVCATYCDECSCVPACAHVCLIDGERYTSMHVRHVGNDGNFMSVSRPKHRDFAYDAQDLGQHNSIIGQTTPINNIKAQLAIVHHCSHSPV
jgi:hypothetical protein